MLAQQVFALTNLRVKNEKIFMYDIIGDIHGHGDELNSLLTQLGYKDLGKGYCHKSRKAIFMGDFIDRGEKLAQHKLVLNTVMSMVNNQQAHAVMGNHEFNALAYHTRHDGKFLRPHTDENKRQHQAFLNEFPEDSEEKQEALDFFFGLPLWLDFGDLRIVHACWDDSQIEMLKSVCPSGRMDNDVLIAASTPGSAIHKAVEVLLKGVEVKLPLNKFFEDSMGKRRDNIRVRWWQQNLATFGEAVIPGGLDIGAAAALPMAEVMPGYASAAPACFIGHYQLTGEPKSLANNITCVDYSVSAASGKLVAYQWDGEQELDDSKYVYQF